MRISPVFLYRSGEVVPIEEIIKKAEGCLGADGPRQGKRIEFFTADGPEEELDFFLELLKADGITSEPLNTVLKKYVEAKAKE